MAARAHGYRFLIEARFRFEQSVKLLFLLKFDKSTDRVGIASGHDLQYIADKPVSSCQRQQCGNPWGKCKQGSSEQSGNEDESYPADSLHQRDRSMKIESESGFSQYAGISWNPSCL